MPGERWIRSGLEEIDTDSRFSVHAFADMYHAALALGLVAHVGDEQGLTSDDGTLQWECAAVLIDVESLGLFVKRLFLLIGAVNEYGDWLGATLAFAPLGAILLRDPSGFPGTGLIFLGFFQRLPDAAHSGSFLRTPTFQSLTKNSSSPDGALKSVPN